MSDEDASVVKGMLRRGDRQHDVAAYFGVNGGRVAEIATGHTFQEVPEASSETLPPAGPYPVSDFLSLLTDAIRVHGEQVVRQHLLNLLDF